MRYLQTGVNREIRIRSGLQLLKSMCFSDKNRYLHFFMTKATHALFIKACASKTISVGLDSHLKPFYVLLTHTCDVLIAKASHSTAKLLLKLFLSLSFIINVYIIFFHSSKTECLKRCVLGYIYFRYQHCFL